MPSYQASVFKDKSSRFHFKDPHNTQSGWRWATVSLPKHLDMSSSGDKIMSHIHDSIRKRKVAVTDRAMHGVGARCISLPIKQEASQDLAKFMELAENLASWWWNLVTSKVVRLDIHMVFRAREPPADSDFDLLDVPPTWEKPASSSPDLWSVVVRES